jgi:hypothetical protein
VKAPSQVDQAAVAVAAVTLIAGQSGGGVKSDLLDELLAATGVEALAHLAAELARRVPAVDLELSGIGLHLASQSAGAP